MEVKQEHARILREALASITKLGNQMATRMAMETLRKYAIALRPYCTHVDAVYLPHENANACLDCGLRFAPTPEPQLPLFDGDAS